MLKSFFWTRQNAFYAWVMLSLLLGIAWYTVEILVFYNAWNKEIYDAIQSLQEERFWTLFLGFDLSRITEFVMLKEDTMPSFLEIITLYTPIAVYATWQTQRYCFKWREANTHHYARRWEKSPAKIEGGSQRIQEDLMIFGKTLQSLFSGFFSAILVLFAFLPILWELSEGLPVWNGKIIPGFLVWVALGVSIGGTLISLILGWKLPKLEYNNQVVEAKFRKQLVFSEDDFKARATDVLFPMFSAVKRNYYRLFNWYMGFGVWQTAFGLAVGNLALVVLAPAYFDQLITLGVLFQVLNAFGRVESSMGYFIDRWTTIVDFLSVIRRIREFNKALDEAEQKG
ncbi:MAG: transporter [Gammaproteobacteria bacterium]|nr:transporter [Gammaproteobacteria bacterium]|tara:strand:+ start:6639 stop:7661 length:1023 start_codon:yes stop_codon:yes gene_type:complete